MTWRAVPAEFKTGMCETKSRGLRFCGVFLGTLVRDRCAEMRAVNCGELFLGSGRVQNRDV